VAGLGRAGRPVRHYGTIRRRAACRLAGLALAVLAASMPSPGRAAGPGPGPAVAWSELVQAGLTRPDQPGRLPWPDDLAPPLVALRRIAADALADRGAALLQPGPEAPGRLHVTVRLTALGQFYDYADAMKRFRAVIFPGAMAEGRIVMRRSPAMACASPFAGHVPVYGVPLKGFGVDYRESPLHAPFDEALERPGGYGQALGAVLAAAWPDGHGPGGTASCRRAF